MSLPGHMPATSSLTSVGDDDAIARVLLKISFFNGEANLSRKQGPVARRENALSVAA